MILILIVIWHSHVLLPYVKLNCRYAKTEMATYIFNVPKFIKLLHFNSKVLFIKSRIMRVSVHSHINIFAFTLDSLTFVVPSTLYFLSATLFLMRKERFIALFYPLQLIFTPYLIASLLVAIVATDACILLSISLFLTVACKNLCK